MKKMNIHFVIFLLALLPFSEAIIAQDLAQQIDVIMEKEYPADGPGATILVAKNGKPIYRKAFGKANLELDVPMKPENVLELGSITKQFTAVAILKLMEEGKLKLEDPLSKFIPDYPSGKDIKIHHLLNHTSGIKSYTDMPTFFTMARTDMTPLALIEIFKGEPMEFAPGEKYKYNNSAYILLGYIIEEVSNVSYEDYIKTNFFIPLGMKNSYYGSKSTLIPNRASGYQPTENGFRNADYLSMTLPYAAGSLMSTVDDMLLWNQAVHNNTLISEKNKKLAFENYKLNDGKPIYYGYGWAVNEIGGTPTIEHGGGIFGYTTSGVYAPNENLYVIVLTNTNGKDPSSVALRAMALALGKPLDQNPVSLAEADLKQWTGSYQFDDIVRFVTLENGTLYSQREGGTKLKLIPLASDKFQFENSFSAYSFEKEQGRKIAYFSDRILKSKGEEAEIKPAEEKKTVNVPTEVLSTYVGTYQLQPGFNIEITKVENTIFGQGTGQPKFELFAESPEKFFVKVVPASVVFNKNSQGEIESLTLLQGGQEMEGKKIK